ncbi:HEPN domain-containing protein [Candidatus Nitrospira bockiana]
MGKKAEYWHPGYSHPITQNHLKDEEPGFQKEVMKEWFLSKFENPAERTPYESAEGGYIYIWGGPFDAREELGSEFGGFLSDEIIEECAQELEDEEGCVEWARIPTEEDYDDSLLETIGGNLNFYATFLESIRNIKMLLNQDLEAYLNEILHRLLFVNIISALESYLSDAFINTVLPNPDLLRKFVETNPDFRERKLTLNEVFKRADQLKDEVKEYLIGLRYHNLAKIKPMYKTTLEIEFPDTGDLFRAIKVRHDLVHRNGKTKDGATIAITKNDVLDLIEKIESFVKEINHQLDRYGDF